VFRDRTVEACVLKVELLGIRAQQGKRDPELSLELGCGLEQRPRDVDSYRTEPAPREPRGDARRATSEFDDVHPCLEAVEEQQLGLGNARYPSGARLRPMLHARARPSSVT